MNFQKSDLKFDFYGASFVFVNSKLVRGILEKQARSANLVRINEITKSRCETYQLSRNLNIPIQIQIFRHYVFISLHRTP